MLTRRVSAASLGTLALVLCLVFVAAPGMPRPIKAQATRTGHPHAALARGHGHIIRLGARTAGKSEPAAMLAALDRPPAPGSRFVRGEGRLVTERSFQVTRARGPPSRRLTTS